MKIEKIKSISFVVILAAIGLLNMGLHTNEPVSKTENRNLQMAPELSIEGFFKEKLTTKIDAFISDQFMFRSNMIAFSKSFEALRGLSSDIEIQTVQGDNMANAGSDNENTNDNETVDENPNIQINYFILEDRAFRSFKKNEASEISYAKAISEYAQMNPDFTVYSLVAPTQASFVSKKYQSYTDDPFDSIKRLSTLMAPEVKFLNTIDLFKANSDDYLFFRTDHHWNGTGAYYGYVAFCEAKGLTAIPIESFEKLEVEDFVGSFYTMTNNETLKEHPDTIQAFVPLYPVMMSRYYMDENKKVTEATPVPYSVSANLMGGVPSYAIFIGGDSSSTVITTDSDQVAGNILVVKDSYGNAFAPYLSNHYKEVHIIDPRFWQGSIQDYMHEHDITEVVFVNNADINLYDVFDETLRKIF